MTETALHQESQNVGSAQIGTFQDIGERSSQEDAFFVNETPPNEPAYLPTVLRRAFSETAQTIAKKKLRGGSTATVAVLSPDDQLTMAHLGDSPVMLFVRDGATGKCTAHLLNDLHNGKNKSEHTRVIRQGGKFDGHSVCDAEKEGWRLGMTRRFGHDNHKYPGVIDTPEITQVDLKKMIKQGDKAFLCVASDGLLAEYPDHQKLNVSPESYIPLFEAETAGGKTPLMVGLATKMAELVQKRDKDYAKTLLTTPKKTDNQTALLVELVPGREKDIVLGVCDGHSGHAVAQTAATELRGKLNRHHRVEYTPTAPTFAQCPGL